MAAGTPSLPTTEDTQLLEARKSSGLLLSDRCRVISVGLLAVIWALFTGDSKSALTISTEVKRLLIGTAAVSIAVLLSDYLQALLQFLDVILGAGSDRFGMLEANLCLVLNRL